MKRGLFDFWFNVFCVFMGVLGVASNVILGFWAAVIVFTLFTGWCGYDIYRFHYVPWKQMHTK